MAKRSTSAKSGGKKSPATVGENKTVIGRPPRKKPSRKPPPGEPTTNQDPQRRLGNFTGTGEAPRKGYRTTGVVGPQKKREAKNRKGR